MTIDASEERVVFQVRFQSASLDFAGRPVFVRYDCCQFVKCMILIDDRTEHLAFTACEFQDCNITDLQANGQRNIISRNNVFKLPLEELQAKFNRRLADALAKKQGK